MRVHLVQVHRDAHGYEVIAPRAGPDPVERFERGHGGELEVGFSTGSVSAEPPRVRVLA